MPNNTDMVQFNVKLSRSVRSLFKKQTKESHGKTMQEVLSAFILSYNSNPQQFNIQTVLGVKSNGSAQRETQEVR